MPKVLSEAEIADFRERLIDAAERLFAEKGLEAVSLRQLAGELGVSAMTPYRYFKDKDEMLAAVRARGFDRFSEALETAFAKPGTADERAAAASDAYVRFALEQPAAYGLMFDLSQPTEGDYPDLVRALLRAKKTMTAHIELLMAEGRIAGDPIVLAHAFWAALHGLVMLRLSSKFADDVDFDAVRRALSGALARGVRPGAGS
ncbi:TetR/AcrR family transcriptional regulator [Phenylobacterium montanum]|uniref:TetR/AcrR family transcriptional regulator n=1 Tax=Phenylobacterium montanum TaxID=2823693 RepID=A0A975FXX1_9CAUL|nr:TetR/AcrR family transcriptional regulator [Caulobacter sp. S6]QUD87186.1 TetR/AcrR family transcriptional regulator [Caulobacter sp. S6]